MTSYASRPQAEALDRRILLADLTGSVFDDLNGDGLRTADERPLAGVRAYLDQNRTGTQDVGERAAVTDAAGNFRFTGLPAGSYRVRADLPLIFLPTRPAAGYYDVTLAEGQQVGDLVFCGRPIPPPGTGPRLGGAVFVDADADGIQDPDDAPLPGWQVFTDRDGDGRQEAGEPVANTNAQGRYFFVGLSPGPVRLVVAVPPGYQPTQPAGGASDFNLAADDLVTRNFGVRAATGPGGGGETGSIRGVVFDDADGDGVRDAGEPSVAGWSVYLDADRNGRHDAGEPTAATTAAGGFAFEQLPAGAYRVGQFLQAGWVATGPAGGFHDVALAAGQGATGLAFPVRQTDGPPTAPAGAIRGTLFDDADADGTRGAGEPGVPGAAVFLDNDGDGQADPGEPAATTAADGAYAFEALAAGAYRVVATAPAGWSVAGPAGAARLVTLAAGQTSAGHDFAARRSGDTPPVVGQPPPSPPGTGVGVPSPSTGDLVGRVFEDSDLDGVRDEAESGVRRAKVYLDLDGDGRLTRGEPKRRTAADGTYAFAALPPGAFAVRVALPRGLRAVDPAGPPPSQVTAGATTTLDLAATRTSMLRGAVFSDANRNRRPDQGEAGQAGVTVFLDLDGNRAPDAGEPQTVTDAAGGYSFVVARGTYWLGEVLPAGWESRGGGFSKVRMAAGRVVVRDVGNQPVAPVAP